MKELLILTGAALAIVGLIILQIRSTKKKHPKAEFLIELLKLIESDSAKVEARNKPYSPPVDAPPEPVKNSGSVACKAVGARFCKCC